jgi:site-specific DNA-adenine methylase
MVRYPGSKAKLDSRILRSMPPRVRVGLEGSPPACYCEPFFGSGAFGWHAIPALCDQTSRVVIGDVDPGIAPLWHAVRDAPRELIRLVQRFEPSVEKFYEFKELDGQDGVDPVLAGFRKVASVVPILAPPFGGKD